MQSSLVRAKDYLTGNREILDLDIKNNGGYPTLLYVNAAFENSKINFAPNCNEIIKLFEETINLGIQHICGEHKMLINAQEFLVYTRVSDLTEEQEEENPGPSSEPALLSQPSSSVVTELYTETEVYTDTTVEDITKVRPVEDFIVNLV